MAAPRTATRVTALAVAAFLAACGGSTARVVLPAEATASAPCAVTAVATLRTVAERVYSQGLHGRLVADATQRLRRSAALKAAVAAGDAPAAAAALKPLLKHQIVRIDLFGPDGRTLVSYGHQPALAPVAGTLGPGLGAYRLSVLGRKSYLGITEQLTGARASLVAAPAALTGDRAAAFAAADFPAGPRAVLLRFAQPLLCGATPRATVVATLGSVARNLFHAEGHNASVHAALRRAARDHAFRAAVAAGDPVATRAAIVGFFKDKRYHIVRVRVFRHGRLLTDLGGPYVLAPATGYLHDTRGARDARFLLAVQDDTGYIKLLSRFTGASVVLQTPSQGLVPGSGRPPRGAFDTYRFTARAFPSGPLRVSLLIPRRLPPAPVLG